MKNISSSFQSRLLIQLREHSDQNEWIKVRLRIYWFWSECSQFLHQKARQEWRALIWLSITWMLFAQGLHKKKRTPFWLEYSRPDETRLTMIEVEVLELCTSTVTRMPTTKPATGFDRITLSWKIFPATLPATFNRFAGGLVTGSAYAQRRTV